MSLKATINVNIITRRTNTSNHCCEMLHLKVKLNCYIQFALLLFITNKTEHNGIVLSYEK